MWDSIVNWFQDLKERKSLLKSFNDSARFAYMAGQVPILLNANISFGNGGYKTNYSWFRSGFRIKALNSGYFNQRVECAVIAMIILSDSMLVRHLISLGFDTLEVGTDSGSGYYQWPLIRFTLPQNV